MIHIHNDNRVYVYNDILCTVLVSDTMEKPFISKEHSNVLLNIKANSYVYRLIIKCKGHMKQQNTVFIYYTSYIIKFLQCLVFE